MRETNRMRKTNTITVPTASLAYADGRDRINAAIRDLQAHLRAHAARQRSHRQDWGYPGDMGRVLTLIQEASLFISAGKNG